MANDLARDLRKTMTRQEVKLWVRPRDLRELSDTLSSHYDWNVH